VLLAGECLQHLDMHKCNRTLLISLSCFLYIFVQYVIGYGGGLLAQDNPVITCALEPGTTVVSYCCTAQSAISIKYTALTLLGGSCMLQALTTQATTKVYKRRSSTESASTAVHSSCSQTLLCSVASGALLALLPDPVTCFRDANYR
jgi:UreD urease accessory protein